MRDRLLEAVILQDLPPTPRARNSLGIYWNSEKVEGDRLEKEAAKQSLHTIGEPRSQV